MKQTYLTFADEKEMRAALFDGDDPRYPALELLNPVPMPVCHVTGAADGGGPIVTPVAGYHVNALVPDGFDTAPLAQWLVTPESPFSVVEGLADE